MKRLLIDATHADETRIAILDGNHLDDFEAETADKVQLKGNIYIGHVSRVEPSLQAAFITYGGNRNGFLAFPEVHPAFFDLPKAEREELIADMTDQAERRRGHLREDGEEESGATTDEGLSDDEAAQKAAAMAENGEPGDEKPARGKSRNRGPIHRRYRIADVLKEGQKILVQVVKEERGSKGAALTTFVSMPGRYTVLMPNTPFAGGISRKISDPEERRQLRDMYAAMKVPDSMGLIIRTAGVGQPVDQVVSDYESMKNVWHGIETKFKEEDDVQCVYEDGSLIVRAIRDMMTDDIDEVEIAGKRAYKMAKDYAKSLMPDAVKKLKEYKDETPLFAAYKVEQKLNQLHFARVPLPSGGYMIINPTEALVAVDINSGRNTHSGNIEDTALRTNLEACDELGRQIRLRDLAGLIVVDFIDMEDFRNVRKVEGAMRRVLRRDRARVQYTDISEFGLMEISRQRLRPSFNENHFVDCPHCGGTGHLHAPSSAAMMVLRRLEEEDCRTADRVVVTTAPDLAFWLLNNKRGVLAEMESRNKYHLVFKGDATFTAPDHKLELVTMKADGSEKSQMVEVSLREKAELPPEERYKQQGPRERQQRERPERGERDERRPRRDEPRDEASADAAPREERSGDKGERRGGRGRDRFNRDDRRDDRGPRRPQRVDDASAAPVVDDAPVINLDEVKAKVRRPQKTDAAPAGRVKVTPPAPPAEDKPLEVAKVIAPSADDTPVIAPVRKKMAIKKQEDTDAADAPLAVAKVVVGGEETPVPAAPKRKRTGLLAKMLG